MSNSQKAASAPLPESANAPLVAVTPESSADNVSKKRKRLAKAFPRPLDKTLREPGRERVKLSLDGDEYACLVELQRRLAALGVRVKKGALLRAGLLLLAAQDDAALPRTLAQLPRQGEDR